MLPSKDPRAAAESAAARKAAILMVSLDQESAARLMGQLERPEQERIAKEIILLEAQPPTPEEREKALRDFYDYHLTQGAGDAGGLRSAQGLLERVLPAGDARRVLEGAQSALGRNRFEFIRKADTASVVNFIGDEHPQMISLILSHLDPAQAARIVEGLPLAKQQEVVRRLASMEPTSPAVVAQVEKALEGRLSTFAASDVRELDGVSVAAAVLNRVPRAVERTIMDGLRGEDPELVDRIRHLMFAFTDVLRVNDRGIQNLLKNVDTSRMAIALRTATPEVLEKFFRNMSKRAVERIKEEMELMGPVRVADVQAAQNAVVDEVLRLEEVGELVIEGRGDAESMVI